MVAATRFGWTVVAFGLVGAALGLVVALLSGASLARLGLFVSAGVVAGSVLLAVFDLTLVRRVLDRPVPATAYEKLPEPVIENGMRITHRPVPAVDPVSGEAILVRPRSTLFGLPLLSWAAVLAGIAGIVLLADLLGTPGP